MKDVGQGRWLNCSSLGTHRNNPFDNDPIKHRFLANYLFTRLNLNICFFFRPTRNSSGYDFAWLATELSVPWNCTYKYRISYKYHILYFFHGFVQESIFQSYQSYLFKEFFILRTLLLSRVEKKSLQFMLQQYFTHFLLHILRTNFYFFQSEWKPKIKIKIFCSIP